MIRLDVQTKIIELMISKSPEGKAEEEATKQLVDFITENIKQFITEDTELIYKEAPKLIHYNLSKGIQINKLCNTADKEQYDKLRKKYKYLQEFGDYGYQIPDNYILPLELYRESLTKENSKELFEKVEKFFNAYTNRKTLEDKIKEFVGSPVLDSSTLESKIPELYECIRGGIKDKA